LSWKLVRRPTETNARSQTEHLARWRDAIRSRRAQSSETPMALQLTKPAVAGPHVQEPRTAEPLPVQLPALHVLAKVPQPVMTLPQRWRALFSRSHVDE